MPKLSPFFLLFLWPCTAVFIKDSSYYTRPSYIDYIQRPNRRHYHSAIQNVPDAYPWCENMRNRLSCGMKCTLLRRICDRAIAPNLPEEYENLNDMISSPSSVAYSNSKFLPNYYLLNKYQPTIKYSKISSIPNVYYASPKWKFGYYRKHPYSNLQDEESPSISPYFSFPEQLTSTTEKPENTFSTGNGTTTTVKSIISNPSVTKSPSSLGKVPVAVATFKPAESEVQTISPLLLDYDHYTTRRYYGDRIYMSAHMPVTSRMGKDPLTEIGTENSPNEKFLV